MKFNVIKTNIINITADAIVLPANEQLREGAGTSRAIFEAAGREKLAKACEKLGHCDVGSAVPTLAFSLNAKFIIHAVVPRWHDGNHGEYDLLSAAYLSALSIADVMGCESIAFPVLAAGNNGFDKALAVRIAKESIEHFSGTKLKQVFLVVYGDTMENFMKTQGYNVLVIPNDIRKVEQKEIKKAKKIELAAVGKDIAQKVLEDQIDKAIEWLKDKKHREMVIQYGIKIAKQAIKFLKNR